MLKRLFQQLGATVSGSAPDPDYDRKDAIRLATAVLLVEVAQADSNFDNAEVAAILELVASHFDLSDVTAEQLCWDAELRAEEQVSVREFARLLNRHLTDKDKAEIVHLMWQIAHADGRLHKYETALVLKIGGLLQVNRAQVMRLKQDAAGD